MKEVSETDLDKFLSQNGGSGVSGLSSPNDSNSTPATPSPSPFNNVKDGLSNGNSLVSEASSLIKNINDLWGTIKNDVIKGADKKEEKINYEEILNKRAISTEKPKPLEQSQNAHKFVNEEEKINNQAKMVFIWLKSTFDNFPGDTKLERFQKQLNDNQKEMTDLIYKVLKDGDKKS